MDLLDEPIDELVFGVKSEGGGSEEDISDIGPSLPGVSIEREDCVEFSDMVGAEHWIFSTDVLGKDSLQLLLLDLSLRHDISYQLLI